MDVEARTLNIEISDADLAARKPNTSTVDGFAKSDRGWQKLYIDHVMQAETGCDLDFLVGSSKSSSSLKTARKPNTATVDGFAKSDRGWQKLYIDHVMQADTGCDLDFLVGSSGEHISRESH